MQVIIVQPPYPEKGKALETLLRCGAGRAMNEYNSWSYTPVEAGQTENNNQEQKVQ